MTGIIMKHLLLLTAAAAFLCVDASAAAFHKIDGTAVTGTLQSVDGQGVMSVQPDKGDVVRIKSDELMRIEFTEDTQPDELIDGVVVYLPGGDRICGKLTKSSQTHVEVASSSLGSLKLSLEKPLALEFRRAGEQPKDAEKMRARMLANQTKNDILFSANGDQMPGILVKFDGDKVVLKSALGEIPLKTSRLFGLSFAARKRAPPPPSLLAVARCADGSIVTGQLKESQKGIIRLALVAGGEVSIPSTALVDLGFKQGKLVYLSDLKPADESYTPYFGGDHTWPYRRDRSYDRKPIRLAGKTYRKGLGTYSGMKLTYHLGGEFSRFVAWVGIDDADVNHHGDVAVRVLTDGKEAFKKASITRKTGPVKIELSMSKVKKLQLVVEFGGNMHFGDLTDWANAHLIR